MRAADYYEAAGLSIQAAAEREMSRQQLRGAQTERDRYTHEITHHTHTDPLAQVSTSDLKATHMSPLLRGEAARLRRECRQVREISQALTDTFEEQKARFNERRETLLRDS
jgi:hypothetical protein